MNMKFGDIFPGGAARARKPEHHGVVDRLPAASRSRALVASLGDGSRPASDFSARPASGPDTRTIAIAVGGRPEDRAKMVCSRGCIAYLCRSA